jgi:hypothetical protein
MRGTETGVTGIEFSSECPLLAWGTIMPAPGNCAANESLRINGHCIGGV